LKQPIPFRLKPIEMARAALALEVALINRRWLEKHCYRCHSLIVAGQILQMNAAA
jgi:hypothetical protein